MSGIDRRVVELDFDNKGFENNAQNSIKTLDALKKGLNLNESAKSLTNLGTAAKGFSLQGISDGVQNISSKFSALGVIGVTALASMTVAALKLAEQLIQTFAIKPMQAGFSEYEAGLSAFQTILANTKSSGATIDDVNKALEDMNVYANKTIYSFGDMNTAIGRFTAQGVNLKDSVSGIKGLYNIIALTGGSAQTAKGAIVQLSQAIAGGTVRAMDWMSVETAGFGGKDFQNQLIQTAKVHGIAVDQMIKKQGTFRLSLQEGWLTSEILLETLQQYAGDLSESQLKSMGYSQKQITQILDLGKTANDSATKMKTLSQVIEVLSSNTVSGWAKSFKIVLGDLNEASNLWTFIGNTIGDVLQASTDSRNQLLEGWKRFGGQVALIDAIKNAFSGVASILAPIKQALEEIFPPKTSQELKMMTVALRDFTAKLKISGSTADGLKRTFKGVFAIFDIFATVVSKLFGGFTKLTGSILPSGNSILGFTARVGDWIVKVRDAIKYGDALGKGFEKIKTFLAPLITVFRNFLNTAGPIFDKIRTFFSDSFKNIDTSGIDKFANKMSIRFEPLKKLVEVTGKVFLWFQKVFEKLSPILAKLGSAIGLEFSRLGDSILKGLDNINYKKIFDVLNGGLISALLIAIKKFVKKGSGALDGISGILNSVKGSLEAWQSSLKAKTLMTIATAIGILAISLIALSMVDSTKLTAALMAVTVMFGELSITMGIIDKLPSGTGLGKVAISMVGLSAAILLLSFAVSKLSKIKTSSMIKGLIGVGVLLAELALFMKVTNLSGMGATKSIGLLLLAGSLTILANVVKKFSEFDSGKLQQGLLGIGAILAELAIFVKLTGNAKSVVSTALGLTVMGGAMLIFANAVQKMGNMSWEQIGKGLATMGGSLLIVMAAVKLMPKNIASTGIGLVIVAGALVILTKALTGMGNLSWDQIGRGLAALGGSLAILAVGLYAMKGSIRGAAAMLIMSAALAVITPALKSLGQMSIEEIGLSLLSLAGTFAVFGVAGLVLGPLTPVILSLAGAMALFGLGIGAVGLGILAFSAGMASLAVSGTAGAAALTVIVTNLLGLIPMIAASLAEAIIRFAEIIGNGAPTLSQALINVLRALINAIVVMIPEVVAAFMQLVTSLLNTLVANAPQMIQAGFDLLMALLTGIRDNIGEIVTVAIDIVVKFLEAVANKLPDIIQAGFDLIVSFIDGLANGINNNLPRILDAGVRLAKAIIDGIVQGLGNAASAVINAILKIGADAIQAIKNALGIASPSKEFEDVGELTTLGLVKGLLKFASSVGNAAKDLGRRAISGISSAVSTISDAVDGNLDITPSIRPVVDLSDVIASNKKIGSMLDNKSINVALATDKLSSIANGMQNGKVNPTQINQPTDKTPLVSFTQNNYSPKELSRLDIYRQTKNQLNMLKGLVPVK